MTCGGTLSYDTVARTRARVVVVVDDLGDRQYDFYVDVDRDRVVTDDDRVAGEGKIRSFELDTEIIREDQFDQATRLVRLRHCCDTPNRSMRNISPTISGKP